MNLHAVNVHTNIDDLWANAIKEVIRRDVVTSRHGNMLELVGYQAALSNIDQNFLLNSRRRLQPAYACAEIIWYLSWRNDIEMITAYAPQYEKFADNGVAHGAYGHRWNTSTSSNQLVLLLEHLTRMRDSRQAVVTMWTADDLWHSVHDKRKDLPCTISLQFLVRDDKLNLIATMRSNDLWLGLPYDIFAFTCIQRIMAEILEIEPGYYVHQAGSEHLYEKDVDKAIEAIEIEHRPLSHYRLLHEWNDRSTTFDMIPLVVNSEGLARTMTTLEPDYFYSNSLSSIMYDLVACCANKWNNTIKPTSPILLEAIKNANR